MLRWLAPRGEDLLLPRTRAGHGAGRPRRKARGTCGATGTAFWPPMEAASSLWCLLQVLHPHGVGAAEQTEHEKLAGKGHGEFQVEMSLRLCQRGNGAEAEVLQELPSKMCGCCRATSPPAPRRCSCWLHQPQTWGGFGHLLSKGDPTDTMPVGHVSAWLCKASSSPQTCWPARGAAPLRWPALELPLTSPQP